MNAADGQIPDPAGYLVLVDNIGIKDDTRDLAIVVSQVPATAAGLYTRSHFAGPSVTLSRAVTGGGSTAARGVVVISKNANVANGPQGDADAAELQASAAALAGVEPSSLVVASTGVIGRPYPMERIRAYFGAATWPPPSTATLADAATAIMTTDTHPKVARARAGGATVVGIAKGVGMIEPDMATMLAFVFTDAEADPAELDAMWRRVVDATFNSVSIDTDTSTSDTAVVFANGIAGPVPPEALEAALVDVALTLTRMIASDGEGASKLLVVTVGGAANPAQAKRVAKAIVNSPLVKTAVHGADPNWGRVVMAVGKCHDDTDIDPAKVIVRIGDTHVYPPAADEATLDAAAAQMRGDEVIIGVDLGLGEGAATVYGCDLTEGYIRINADYTT